MSNPAVYVAGIQALIVGICIVLATSWLGSHSRTHFDGVLDVHTGADAPMWFFLSEGVIAWLSAVIFCLIAGKIAARTSFRLLDLAGTQALARTPLLFVSLFALIPAYERFSRNLMQLLQDKAPPAPATFLTLDAMFFLLVIVVMVLAICWMVALMYRSYAHVCNIRGGRAVVSFIVALLLAEIASKAAFFVIATHALQTAPQTASQTARNPEAEKVAVEAARAWLSLVDTENYAESWDEAAQVFKSAVPQEQWVQTMQSGRKPFGKNLSRETKSTSYHTSLPGAPSGQYVVIQFTASFENKKSAIETVTPMLDADGAWRVSGYYMK